MTTPEPRRFSAANVVRGALLAIAGHVVVIVAAFIAGQIVEPSDGGGVEDLAAVAVVLLGGELLLFLACFIGGIVSFIRRKPDLAVGLLGGWLLGGLLTWLLTTAM